MKPRTKRPVLRNRYNRTHGACVFQFRRKDTWWCAAVTDGQSGLRLRGQACGNYCVTASIDTVDFLQPVEVGDLVSLMASVNYVGNTSLVVGIRVISENIKTNTISHTNTSYFTMVAKDEHDNLVQIPGLILENREDVRRFYKPGAVSS